MEKKSEYQKEELEVFVQNFKDIPIGKIYTKFYSEYQKEKFRCVCTKF